MKVEELISLKKQLTELLKIGIAEDRYYFCQATFEYLALIDSMIFLSKEEEEN